MSAHAKRPDLPTLASAFKFFRTKLGYSYDEVSRKVGQSRETIRSWEEGKAFPRGRDIPRLCSVMRELRPYVRLIPKTHLDTEEDVRGLQVASATVAAGPPPPLPPAPAPATTFHEALKRERIASGFSQREFSEFVGVHPATVSGWEDDKSLPVRVNYEKLLDLLPGLKNGPVPDIQDIDPPVGTKYKNKGVVRGEPPTKESQDWDEIEVPPQLSSPPTPPAPPPVTASSEPLKPSLPELAAAWSEALVKQNSARLFYEECEKTMSLAKEELEQTTVELETAKKAVDDAALEMAKAGRPR